MSFVSKWDMRQNETRLIIARLISTKISRPRSSKTLDPPMDLHSIMYKIPQNMAALPMVSASENQLTCLIMP